MSESTSEGTNNTETASLGDKVWEDTNGNGVQDDGEQGVGFVIVNLYTCIDDDSGQEVPGELLATTVTSNNSEVPYPAPYDDVDNTLPLGEYRFDGLPAGRYIVEFFNEDTRVFTQQDVGDNDQLDSDVDAYGFTGCFTLANGEINDSVDAGLVAAGPGDNDDAASLGDKVWEDMNANGVQDEGEPGINGITVELYDCTDPDNHVLVDSTMTADGGKYRFEGLLPGQYKVKFLSSDGYMLSESDQTLDENDSDADADGFSGCYTLAAGEDNTTVDAGFYKPATLGDYVWQDSDGDGVQDADESGLAGVTVRLLDCNGERALDNDDNLVADQISGSDGSYSFTNLIPGDYSVQFIGQDGAIFTQQLNAEAEASGEDSDANAAGLTGCVTLSSGDIKTGVDAGLIPHIAGAIDIETCVETSTTQAEMRTINFDADAMGNALAAGTVIDFEYEDWGVHISSSNQAGKPAMIFDSANPTGGDMDLRSPGYGLGNNVAEGNVLIISEDGDSSDPDDNASGGTLTFTFDEPARLFNIGLLDIEESGGVIRVYDDNDTVVKTVSIPAMGDNSSQEVALDVDGARRMEVQLAGSGAITGVQFSSETTTNSCDDADVGPGPSFNQGEAVVINYKVTNPGEYALQDVVVIDDNGTPDDSNDDIYPAFTGGDTDGDGKLDINETWAYQAMAMSQPGLNEANAKATGTPVDNFGNMGTLVMAEDPHFYTVSTVETSTIQVPQLAELGERVWLDSDCDGEQDAGEAGVEGVTVRLKDSQGNVLVTTVTDANGNYLFPELAAGVYSVAFEADGFMFTQLDAAADDVDSDVDSNGMTGAITLSAGESNLDVDAGLIEFSEREIWYDFNGRSSLDGADGNVRSYEVDGVTVTGRAFSRDNSGVWDEAYLGAYSGGHGVTDQSEGSGSYSKHTLDNVGGTNNYVVYQFSQDVTVDQLYLGYVRNDSDLRIWIGSSDSTITTMSDAVLEGMDFTEVDWTSKTGARYVDINAGESSGNVLIVAAAPDDTTPEDYFKLQKLCVQVKETACEAPGGDSTVIEEVPGVGGTVIEAEDMQRSGYGIEHNADASGESVVKLSSWAGSLTTTFEEASGFYNLTLNYIDESDGEGTLKVKINGHTVKVTSLDQQIGDHKDGFTDMTLYGLELNAGDEITVEGLKQGGEYARVDSLKLVPCRAPIVVEAEDMDRDGYKLENNSEASGGVVTKLSSSQGSLSTQFSGENGEYNLTINYIDENDGYGKLGVAVNGDLVDTIHLTKQVGDHKNGFTSAVIEDLQLEQGDEVSIMGQQNKSEYARVDSLSFTENCASDDTIDMAGISGLSASSEQKSSSYDLTMQALTQDDRLFAYEADTAIDEPIPDVPELQILGGTIDDSGMC